MNAVTSLNLLPLRLSTLRANGRKLTSSAFQA